MFSASAISLTIVPDGKCGLQPCNKASAHSRVGRGSGAMPGSSHGHDADGNEDREHDKLCHRRRARSERVQAWYLQERLRNADQDEQINTGDRRHGVEPASGAGEPKAVLREERDRESHEGEAAHDV